jgi:hypothetical protein
MRGMGKRLMDHVTGPVSIVPIPNSDMLVGAKGSFRIISITAQLQGILGALSAIRSSGGSLSWS